MIRWLFNFFARFNHYHTEWVEDLPENLQKNTVYIIGGRKNPFYAAVVCPRKVCRQTIHLDISPQATKKWRIIEHTEGQISLVPSIHITGLPCKCHYWLQKGQIIWSETPPVFVPKRNKND